MGSESKGRGRDENGGLSGRAAASSNSAVGEDGKNLTQKTKTKNQNTKI